MGVQEAPAQLFYDFDMEAHVPADHMLRAIDRFLDFVTIREQLKPYYSHLGRPSIDSELIVRMLVVGYVLGIRSERRLAAKADFNPKAQRKRKKVEMLFAHLKRILGLGRLRLRGPCGAKDEFILAAIAQNLRKLAKLRPKSAEMRIAI